MNEPAVRAWEAAALAWERAASFSGGDTHRTCLSCAAQCRERSAYWALSRWARWFTPEPRPVVLLRSIYE
jgi:hypothetical protein